MRLYWEIARRGYRRYAAYRAATVAGVFTNCVFGFIRGYILLALFREQREVGGYSVADTLTYVWLTQGIIATIFIWGWFELARRIQTGDIATDLVRPADIQGSALAFDLGRSVYHAIFRGVPPVLVGALFFELTAPSNVVVWVAFLASVVLAVCVSFAYRFLYNLASFWLLDYRGATIFATLLATFFSGILVPVRFFPDWLAAIAYALPFWTMVQLPADIFVGAIGGVELAGALALQAAWVLVLLALGRLVLARGTRRLVIQGG